MYKNLSPSSLGISGRQSEIIELALTHRAKGLELDMDAFKEQVDANGYEYASRFVASAGIVPAPFEVPMRWYGEDLHFKTDLQTSKPFLEIAQKLGCVGCVATIQPYSDSLPYHENFERHRERITSMAATLAEFDLKLGLNFLAPAYHRKNKPQPFVCTAEALIALLKMTAAENLGIILDSWHWQVGGGTIEQVKELRPEQIVEVRLSDVPESADLEAITEEQRVLPGTVPNSLAAKIVAELLAKKYKGPVTPATGTQHLGAVKRDDAVRKAFAAIDHLIKLATQGPEVEEASDDDSTVEKVIA
jgi:sugar phosphate isomerase/epimerase